MHIRTIAVIGASGGIGSAMAEELRNHYPEARLVLTARSPDRYLSLRGDWLPLDLENEQSITAAAAETGEADIVCVATGMLHEGDLIRPEKTWNAIDPHAMARSFAVNAIGPALVMKHFLPLLSRERRSVMALLSARVGSISDNRLGGWYSYRASKAALNQLIRTASVELARKNSDAVCVGLHPGTVATPLSAPFGGGERLEPHQSASRLVAILQQLSLTDSGKVFDWKGERVPD